MDIILFNPLSRNGRDPRYVERIKTRLEKEGHDVRVQDLLTIQSVETFIKTCAPDDRIVILGGDGTLSRVADAIHGHAFTQDILVARAGTGNDFVRSLKTKETFVKVNTFLERLPLMATDGVGRRVINGAGIGLDGFVGHLVNTSTKKKNKFNYFRHTLEGFVKFRPVKASVTIDGKSYRVEKAWLVAVMHGAYFGGGMKIAPKASRKEDEIHVIVIKDIPKWLLTFIFPSIYMGRHTIFRRYVDTYVGKHVTIVTDNPTYAQIDGDTVYPVTTLTADIHES